MSAQWLPATPLEQALLDATQAADQQAYLGVLQDAELLVPLAGDGEHPMTSVVEGRTYLLAFTSPETLRTASGSELPYRSLRFADLVAGWPDPQWWLVVNPGTPVEAHLPASSLAQLASASEAATRPPAGDGEPSDQRSHGPADGAQGGGDDPAPPVEAPASDESDSAPPPEGAESVGIDPSGLPPLPMPGSHVPLRPANQVEEALERAVRNNDADALLKALLLAELVVPIPDGASVDVRPGFDGFQWRVYQAEGEACIPVFSSTVRCAEILGEVPITVAEGLAVVHYWPDSAYTLALNPGTPIGASLPGPQVRELAEWAAQIGLVDLLREYEQAGAAQRTERPVAPNTAPAAPEAASPTSDAASEPAEASTAAEPTSAEPASREPASAEPAVSVPEQSERESPVTEPASAPASIPDPAVPHPAATQAPQPPSTPEPPAAPLLLQKLVPHQHVAHYLQRGYDLISGLAHAAEDVAEVTEPAKLYAMLGLARPDSGFTASDPDVYLLRWVNPVPALAVEATAAGQIRQFRFAGVRLPHGTQLWRYDASGAAALIAVYDADVAAWKPAEGGAAS